MENKSFIQNLKIIIVGNAKLLLNFIVSKIAIISRIVINNFNIIKENIIITWKNNF